LEHRAPEATRLGSSVADLGFYKGGCGPIHLKGDRKSSAKGAEGWIGISYIKMVSLYAFLEIFIDTVTALTTCFEHIFFHKRAP